MSTVLGVNRSQLGRLSGMEAVDIFAGLLWADSAARGIPADIDVPRNIHARNGGVNATVRAPDGVAGQGVIGPGVTRYQIKSGRGFNPASRGARRRLLFRPAGGGLRPRIKRCLDNGETLVLVLFGTDAPDAGRDSAQLIREELAKVDPSYGRAKVEVWHPDRLIGYIEKYPALQRRLAGTSGVPFRSHSLWALASEAMTRRFVPGPSHRRLIDRARSALRGGSRGADVRITGGPGSGKTRIAHEITRPDDLAAITLYFESPSDARSSVGLVDSLVGDGDARAILVVDECGREDWEYFRNRIARAGGRIGLVTMHNKMDGGGCYDLDGLGAAEIGKIIREHAPGAPSEAVDRLAVACEPSPRYAHYFAKRMASNPNALPPDLLDEDGLHEAHIGAGLGPQSGELARKRKLVLLQFCAFARVGCEGESLGEYEFLRKKSGQEDGIAPNEFDAIVDDLRGLKMLRGREALRIAPSMLHLWLRSEWRRLRGRGPSPAAPLQGGGAMPGSLRRALLETAPGDSSAGAAPVPHSPPKC